MKDVRGWGVHVVTSAFSSRREVEAWQGVGLAPNHTGLDGKGSDGGTGTTDGVTST